MSMANVGKRLLVWAVLTGAVLVTGASAESKARIVRLSEVQGDVQMDRDTGGFEKAFLNLPVIEGAKLKTGDASRAEVEFEDGSVLRIVPNSELDFTRLTLGDDGQKLSTVELVQGTAYANVSPKKGDRFTLNFGHESVTLTESAHFRTSLTKNDATLAVFQGDVQVTGPSGTVEIGKKHSATFDLANNDSYTLAKNYDEDPNDKWDQKQNDYRSRYSSNGVSGVSSPYAYGMSDLNYYGNYFNAPGYGMVWQPYFTGMGWSPFQDGGWAWYPGFGYMWVSAYPWGWMPYRYGNWLFVPGFGWVWQPGLWNTWFAIPRVVNPPVRTAVPTPPVRSRATVMVGRGLTVNPVAEPPRRLTIAAGSAGLGVPRGAVRHLDRFAKEAVKSSGPVVVTTARPPMSGTMSGVGPTASPAGSVTSAPRASPATRTSSPPARSSKPH